MAGASGVIGSRLVRVLVADGHLVSGLMRSATGSAALLASGVSPLVCDVFNASGLMAAVRCAAPDLVVHQLTDLPDDRADVRRYAGANTRMRREGTRNLIRAAKAAGVERLIAQSVAWDLTGEPAEAVRYLESAVLRYPGVVLRYGQFYGPGTYWTEHLPPEPRIHVDRAAELTAAVLLSEPQILTVVDERAAGVT